MNFKDKGTKTYRVIQWATGRLGTAAVAGIVSHRDLKLVGAWVHSEEKEGRDVGELCGLEPLGVYSTRDKDALLAMPADCVCYMVSRKQSKEETFAELARILRAGKNVVNSKWGPLVYPPAAGDGVYEQLQEACLEGKSSLYTSAIDPGWGTLGLAISALTLSSEVRSVRMYEILSYADWTYPDENPEVFSLHGFGQPDVDKCVIFTPGLVASVWGPTVSLVAEAMGVKLDEILEAHDVIYAKEAFDIMGGHIPVGTISGQRFQIKGMIGGEERVVVDHVTKLRDKDYPEVPFPGGGYRVEIDGEPRLRLDLSISSHRGNMVHAGYVAAAMAVVNAIPAVCDAPPGVLSYLDLMPHPSKNLLSGHP